MAAEGIAPPAPQQPQPALLPPDRESLTVPPPPPVLAPPIGAGTGPAPAAAAAGTGAVPTASSGGGGGSGQVNSSQQPSASHPSHPSFDPSLDPTIKHLLDQQAEIQAKLDALLPQKYGANIKVELDMLRHKLRVLRAYADENREPSPILLYCTIYLPLLCLSTIPFRSLHFISCLLCCCNWSDV